MANQVRILIFDDPAENERGQRPPRGGKLSNPRGAHRAGCMHGENLRNPARTRRAAAMRQFPSNQHDSTVCVYTAITARSACVHRCTSTVLNLVLCLCLYMKKGGVLIFPWVCMVGCMGTIFNTNLKNRMVISRIATSQNHIEPLVPCQI